MEMGSLVVAQRSCSAVVAQMILAMASADQIPRLVEACRSQDWPQTELAAYGNRGR